MPPIATMLPAAGQGFYSYAPIGNRYGQMTTITALVATAVGWWTDHLMGKSLVEAARIGIGDLSLAGGGPMPGHKSHRTGREVDIRPVRRDAREGPVTITQEFYSARLTQGLVDRLWQNGRLPVHTLLFNDRSVAGVKYFSGHNNHLHARFGGGADDHVTCSLGSRGVAVQQAQRRLNCWLDAQGKALMLVDGAFGPRTEEVTRAFQSWHSLPVDGVIGPATWAPLLDYRPWEVFL